MRLEIFNRVYVLESKSANQFAPAEVKTQNTIRYYAQSLEGETFSDGWNDALKKRKNLQRVVGALHKDNVLVWSPGRTHNDLVHAIGRDAFQGVFVEANSPDKNHDNVRLHIFSTTFVQEEPLTSIGDYFARSLTGEKDKILLSIMGNPQAAFDGTMQEYIEMRKK